nr:juvenile hormone acid O-methyltransferase-like [Rhipicephalus microplus]
MLQFATERFSDRDIVHDVLDIVTPDLDPFLKKYGKFQRAFAFLVFHMIRDQSAAYGNIAKLLTDDGECLVVADSSYGLMDLWKDVYDSDNWKGVIQICS